MSIQYQMAGLAIAAIVCGLYGFLAARAIIRRAGRFGKAPDLSLSTVWIFGGCITFALSVPHLLVADEGRGFHPTSMTFLPLLILLSAAGSFTVTWYKLNTNGYRFKVRRQLRDKGREERKKRTRARNQIRRHGVSPVRAARPTPRVRR